MSESAAKDDKVNQGADAVELSELLVQACDLCLHGFCLLRKVLQIVPRGEEGTKKSGILDKGVPQERMRDP